MRQRPSVVAVVAVVEVAPGGVVLFVLSQRARVFETAVIAEGGGEGGDGVGRVGRGMEGESGERVAWAMTDSTAFDVKEGGPDESDDWSERSSSGTEASDGAA